MKMLIISSGRAGSTNLLKGLKASINDSLAFCEPTNGDCSTWLDNPKGIDLSYNKTIVKVLGYQVPNEFISQRWGTTTEYLYQNSKIEVLQHQNIAIEYWKEYYLNFDKVILLSRQNELEAAKSYMHAMINNEWHQSYKFNYKELNYLEAIPLVRNHNDILYNLSRELNVPITYYEDIFTDNIKDLENFLTLNQIKVDHLDILFEYLSNKKRYRQN